MSTKLSWDELNSRENFEHCAPNDFQVPDAQVLAMIAEIHELRGKLDIIKRTIEHDEDALLANDYGGTGWELDPIVEMVRSLVSRVDKMPKADGEDKEQLDTHA